MSKLFVVPTPIGNLEDMTFRAIRVLKEVSLILAEDTRTAGKLLKHFEIRNSLQSHHKFNEHRQVQQIAEQIASGMSVALISDAGTPGISDPGYLLVKKCVECDVNIETLPGATAFIPALVNSGLPNDRFLFEGFLPQKKGRQKRIKALESEQRTMVFYESPYRILKALQQFIDVFGADRQASISREISKMHEETVRGNLAELLDYYQNNLVKGEFVIVVAGQSDSKKTSEQFDKTK